MCTQLQQSSRRDPDNFRLVAFENVCLTHLVDDYWLLVSEQGLDISQHRHHALQTHLLGVYSTLQTVNLA